MGSDKTRIWWPALFLLAVFVCGWTAALAPMPKSVLAGRLVHIGTFLSWTLGLSALFRCTLDWAARPAVELGLGAACAVVAELLQYWLPHHRPDWRGLLMSLAGVLLAGAVMAARGCFRRPAHAEAVVAEAGTPRVEG
jgi:hypothetical protein